jgi:hypothetical protein
MLALSAGAAHANVFNGTISFSDNGSVSCTSPGIISLNTCTAFQIGGGAGIGGFHVTSTTSTGDFSGFPNTDFGTIDFDITVPTSFILAAPAFGSFSSTSITTVSNVPGARALYFTGTYVCGLGCGIEPISGPVSEDASFTLSFTQTPAGVGGLSDSGTFSDPPSGFTSTPEPGTWGLIGSALIGVGAMIRRSRKAKA